MRKENLKMAISLILVFAMIFSLAACGSKQGGEGVDLLNKVDNAAAVKALNLKDEFLSGDTAATNLKVNNREGFFVVDGNPDFSWNMVSSARGEEQIAYFVGVSTSEDKAKNGDFDVWYSGVFAGNDTLIKYGAENGVGAKTAEALKPQTIYYYAVGLYNKDAFKVPLAIGSFETGLLGDFGKDNKWIDFRTSEDSYDLSPASTLFRKQFKLSQGAENIVKARLYATALGNHIMYINGQRAGKDYMAPGKSNLETYLYYQTYDVTGKLKSGDNTIAAEVGYGWYNAGSVGDQGGKNVALKTKLIVTYKDGSTQVIDSDDSWLATKEGHTTSNQYYGGQNVDGNQRIAYWNSNGSNSSKWKKATASDEVSGSKPIEVKNNFIAEIAEPVTVVETFNPISAEPFVDGNIEGYIYKLPQNIAGTLRLTASAPKGTKITIVYTEYSNGMIAGYQGHNGTDTYVFAGTGNETVEFDLVYHGFQYIIIYGLDNQLPFKNIEALALSSLKNGNSSFESSNSEMNQFVKNTMWTIRNNCVSTFTDCPTREKNSWSGDAQAISYTTTYIFNTYNNFKNIISLLKASQNNAGGTSPILGGNINVNETAPVNTRDTIAVWCDAMVIIPWNMYKASGNISFLSENYNAMKKYLNRVANKPITFNITDENDSQYYIRKGESYGDWLSAYSKKSKKYSSQGYYVKDTDQGQIWVETHYEDISTAYAAYMARIMSDSALILGYKEDAEKYADISEKYAAAWRREWLEEDGVTPKSKSQTSYALGLELYLYEEENREKAAKQLAELIAEDKYMQTSGLVGTNFIYKALQNNGQSATAFKLFFNDTNRSSIWALRNYGATTIPESLERETGDHYAFGTPTEWIYSSVLGISQNTESYGYGDIVIAPTYNKETGVTWAKGSYQSTSGEILSDWKLSDDGKTFTLKCKIPCNSKAVIALPITSNNNTITEGEKEAKNVEGLEFIEFKNGRAYFKAVSGKYNFTVNY